jgi:hypothetical protein
MTHITELYKNDGHAWYFENARLLKEKRFEELDLDNLIEEVESMGRNQRNTLGSYFAQLFLHLLKWQYQPERRGSSWQKSINFQRINIKKQMKENPSLKGCFHEIALNEYEYSRKLAVLETNLDILTFPEEMPFTLDEALQEDWLPE